MPTGTIPTSFIKVHLLVLIVGFNFEGREVIEVRGGGVGHDAIMHMGCD